MPLHYSGETSFSYASLCQKQKDMPFTYISLTFCYHCHNMITLTCKVYVLIIRNTF